MEEWLKQNRISAKILSSTIIETELGRMMKVGESSEKLFDSEFQIILTESEEQLIVNGNIEYLIFNFGGNYYYTPVGESKLIPLKWIGKIDSEFVEVDYAFLGVHGIYESMNGLGNYSDWCKKAKYLGHTSLGICEFNTLGGSLPFQEACKKADIKPIIGESFLVSDNLGNHFRVKFFVLDQRGWRNLLKMHTYVNLKDEENFLQISELKGEGLCAILIPSLYIKQKHIDAFVTKCDKVFFQIDSTQYASDSIDKDHLVATKRFLSGELDPILTWDAYCLEREDIEVRNKLKKGSSIKFQYTSLNEYYKPLDEVCDELEILFGTEDSFLETLDIGLKSINWVKENSNFQIDTSSFHLPEYQMTEKEKKEYSNNEDLFMNLIAQGVEKVDFTKHSESEVMSRLNKEIGVIKKGGFIDYFLILWDIIQWCDSVGIVTGVGRGSAGGSLVSYCLGIIKLNPLDYGLLFERFLNEGRLETSLPDIDTDFEADRRDEVIEYMKERYGRHQVCRLGTYGTLQLRGVVQELSRSMSKMSPASINIISKGIEDSYNSWDGLFLSALKKPFLKEFLLKNVEIVNSCRIALGAIKSQSIHACGTLIVPKEDKDGNPMTIYDWMPVRRADDGTLISEWEGDMVEKAGFLKEDILSTRQMAKVADIFRLVKDRYLHTRDLSLEEIPLDDENVYDLFCKGYNKDVFHFGSEGLTKYSKVVQPRTIEELIAMIALYRPGAMQMRAHENYVKFKHGEKVPVFDKGLESVTQQTYGLYVYQEQLMQSAQVLANFNLVDADGLRKAMGKKIPEKMASYKDQFIAGAKENGFSEEHALDVWGKVEAGAAYQFNKSHAAAYAITGYICNWLKYYYPLEFWTIAFKHAKEENVPSFLTEVFESGKIRVAPPDINKSGRTFESDVDSNEIYWSISKIDQVGPVALDAILSEREVNGKFFDLEEFVTRTSSRAVTKSVVESLIYAGAFDKMYSIEGQPKMRSKIISEYFIIRDKKSDKFDIRNYPPFDALHWTLKQREVSGFSFIPYREALKKSKFKLKANSFLMPSEALTDEMINKRALVGGIVIQIDEGNLERGRPTVVTLDCNYELVTIKMFPDVWFKGEVRGFEDIKDRLEVGNLLFLEGKVREKNEAFDENHYLQVTGRYKKEVKSSYDIVSI